MSILSENSNNDVRFVLAPASYLNLFNRLKRVLPTHLGNFFSKPNRRSSRTIYTSELANELPPTAIRSFEQLEKDEQDDVADIIEQAKTEITAILKADEDFADKIDGVFMIPSTKDIKVFELEGEWKVVLTQWGCNANESDSGVSPIIAVIERPRPNRVPVNLHIKHSETKDAVQVPFWVDYKGRIKQYRSNEEGKASLGNFKKDLEFTVFQQKGGERKHVHNFVVKADQTYEVIFPLLAKAEISVQNAKGEIQKDLAVKLGYEGKEEVHKTDPSGKFLVDDLLVGKEIFLQASGKGTEVHKFEIKPGLNEIVITLLEIKVFSRTVRVLDQDGKIVPNVKVVARQEKMDKTHESGEDGTFVLENIQENKELRLIEQDNRPNVQTYQLKEEDREEVVFKVNVAPPKVVSIQLVNLWNQAISRNKMKLSFGGKTHDKETDAAGKVSFPFASFQDGEKVEAAIARAGRTKDKWINRSFAFQKDKLNYKIRLIRLSWWLLLLLLPLLLLIQCEKEVFISAINESTSIPVENVPVSLEYTESFLLDKGKLFANNPISLEENTNSNGIATFGPLRYSLYSLLFKRASSATITVLGDCYSGEEKTRYHSMGNRETLTIDLAPAMTSVNFQVVDKDDQEPLPDTEVRIIASMDGETYRSSATSDPGGMVVFDDIPRCARLEKLISSIDGYRPDSIVNQDMEKVLQDIKNRKLEPDPIRKSLKFRLTRCKPGSGNIAGGKVVIKIEGRKDITRTTNVNGIGKGFYKDVRELSDVTVIAQETPYYYAAGIPKMQVRKFARKLQFICQKPKPKPVTFRVIDSLTRFPVAGARQLVTTKNGKQKAKTVELFSNNNGEFLVTVIDGDEVSIKSSNDPDYIPDSTSIFKADGVTLKNGPASGRTIALSPKTVKLLFKTVEKDDPTQEVGQADLTMKFNVKGREFIIKEPRKSGSNGVFSVRVPEGSKLYISAGKMPRYLMNLNAIDGVEARSLVKSLKAERTIPLEKAKDVEKCDTQTLEDNNAVQYSKKTYDMGQRSGTFLLEYFTDTQADSIVVSGMAGPLWSSGIATNKDTLRQAIPFIGRLITVEVKGSSNWYYKVNCP